MFKKWIHQTLLVAGMCTVVNANAGPITIDFSLGGFSNNGFINGSFTGEDLNGDGYISSFVFSRDADFENTPFTAGLNEVTRATAEFTGSFEASTSDSTPVETITSASFDNDLTVFNPGFPLNFFFVLNYKLGSRYIGDNEFEGLHFGVTNIPFVFSLGQFVPIPPNIQLFDTEGVPGGSTLTNALLRNNANGAPCINGNACGIIHTVFLDNSTEAPFDVITGGFDLSNEFAVVDVAAPAGTAALLISVLALIGIRRKTN